MRTSTSSSAVAAAHVAALDDVTFPDVGAPGDTSEVFEVFAKSALAYSPSRSRTFSLSGAGAASSPPMYEYRPATSHARTSAAATRRLDVASRTPPPAAPSPAAVSMPLLTPRPRRLRPSAPSPPFSALNPSPVSNLTHGSKRASQSSFASPRTAGRHRPGLFTKTGSFLDPAERVALFPLRPADALASSTNERKSHGARRTHSPSFTIVLAAFRTYSGAGSVRFQTFDSPASSPSVPSSASASSPFASSVPASSAPPLFPSVPFRLFPGKEPRVDFGTGLPPAAANAAGTDVLCVGCNTSARVAKPAAPSTSPTASLSIRAITASDTTGAGLFCPCATTTW
mmetsp:Transcript_3394/g.12711  ORF Transcript_3394/g.12711 Transcript_3394/m.12711 type:complete len:342 (+) Transcript_3394:2440-3465(+)